MEEKSLEDDDNMDIASAQEGAKYKIGDILDGRDPELGSWHEVTLKKIVPATSDDDSKLKPVTKPKEGSNEAPFPLREQADKFVYHVIYDG